MSTGISNRALARLTLALPTEAQLRDRFKALAQIYLPELTDLNDISDLMRMGDLLAAFFNRYAMELLTDIANEAFVATASDYDFLATRALEVGYTPSPGNGSTVSLTLSNRSTLAIAVNRTSYVYRTKRMGETAPVEFEMVPGSVTVPAGGSVTFEAVQGMTVWNESLGSGDGTGLQQFYAAQARAVPDSERVYVAGIRWTLAPRNNLLIADATDTVYERWFDEDGKIHILFGDGEHGKKPADGEAILISYRIIPDGQDGNVPAASVIEMTPSNSALSVTNAIAASGWVAPDLTEDMRFQAARSARVPWDVCVAEEDTEVNVEREFDEVGRCYVAPGERGENTIGVHILDTEGDNPPLALKNEVLTFVERHNPATELSLVLGPSWTDIVVSAIVIYDTSYVAGSGAAALVAALGPLAYDSAGNRAVLPGMIFYHSIVTKMLMGVTGVVTTSIISPTVAVAVGVNCLPRFTFNITETAE